MRDTQDLTMFLTHDVSYFERSTYGAMMDQLIAGAYGGRECPDCLGLGILDKPWVQTRNCHGERIDPIEHPTGKWCPKCRGNGCLATRIRSGGEGVTVRPTHAQQVGVRSAPPDDVLRRYARVSRRLLRIGPRLSAALCAAYGDAGEAHAGELLLGRSWAAAPLTRAGRRILAGLREGKVKADDVSPWRSLEALNDQIKQQGRKPLKVRGELLAQAEKQARELVEQAEKAWDES